MTHTNPPGTATGVNVIHLASGDLWAGAEVQLFNLVTHLRHVERTEVSVVLLNHGPLEQRLRAVGIDVTVYPETRISSLRLLTTLIRHFRDRRPQIVHTHRQKENVLGALAARLAGVPHSVRTVHGRAEHFPAWWRLDKFLFRLLDTLAARYLQEHVIAVSHELGHAVAKHFSAGKIVVIENGIDADAVRAAASRHVALPGPPRRFRVAFVGRLVPVKRPDLFVDMAALVAAGKNDELAFYLFGGGSLRESLVQQIDRLALSGSVHVMGEVTDLYPALAQMDAVVITSDHEGLPMLLLEAITLEVPVIAHAVGAIPHVLRAGEYGTLVVHQQAAAYAQAVSDLVVDPAPARTRARQGRQNLETLYSARTSAEKHHRLYRDLLRAERPAITCTTDSDALPGSERGDNTPPASRPRTRRTAR